MVLSVSPIQTDTPYRLLESRSQYESCHIRVPDIEERLPALLLDQKFYSFFRVVFDEQQLLSMVAKLNRQAQESIVTRVARGYAIWVLEPTAYIDAPRSNSLQAPADVFPYRILESRNQYKPCHIRVPDVEQRLVAIRLDDTYYSFFAVTQDKQNILKTIAKTKLTVDQIVITTTAKGYVVWVLEPQVRLQPSV
jgi:tRNA U34 5-carboxymethylaminomethyl modifying enzyme MnmG/GidA